MFACMKWTHVRACVYSGCIHAYMCQCMCMHSFMCVCVCKCMCAFMHAGVCMHMCVCDWLGACVRVYMYVRTMWSIDAFMCVHVCAHAHVHIHVRTLKLRHLKYTLVFYRSWCMRTVKYYACIHASMNTRAHTHTCVYTHAHPHVVRTTLRCVPRARDVCGRAVNVHAR